MSPNGIYAVNFYTLGVPHTIIVDDFIPAEEWYGNYYTVFSKFGPDSSAWGPILEKAFAKYHGNYAHIVGGDSRIAAKTLSNAPYDSLNHTEYSKDLLYAELKSRDNSKELIQVNTSGNNNAY